jgi:hypothetical protein
MTNLSWEREPVRKSQTCYIEQMGRGVVDEEGRCVIVRVIFQIRMGKEGECESSLLMTNA